MQSDPEISDILLNLKAQDIKSANLAPLPFETDELVVFHFNSHLYFAVLKSLNEILLSHYKNEQNNGLGNKELSKFTYLGQIHLTRLTFNAIIHPEHIEYSCFELGVFYLVLLNLAKHYQFPELARELTQLQNRIFQSNFRNTLITSNLSSFQLWYQSEINLYEQQFSLHFNNTAAGKITFITNIASEIKVQYACQIINTYKDPKYDFYQKQLAFKLIEYLFLDSIYVEFSTRKIIAQLMEYMNSVASDDDKQKKLESTANEYKSILLSELKKRALNNSRETILDLSLCDYRNLILDLASFINVSFVNFDKHTRLPNKFRFCIFKNITFTEQMFQETTFYGCIFINCTFNKLIILCNFNACTFEKCNFTDVAIRFSDFSRCTLFQCLINNFQLYRVTAVGMKIKDLTLTNTSIIFSNIQDSIFNTVKFHAVSFEGTMLNERTRFQSCTIRGRASDHIFETTLQGALILKSVSDNEYRFDEVEEIFALQIGYEDIYKPLIITTEQLGTHLSQFTQSEFLNNSTIDPNIRFKKLLGWILCAVDRLKEYCEDFEINSNIRTFDTFAVFEIVAVHVKTAMTHLNRFLSLYDRCHLSLMNQTLLKSGLFKNFQQYQQIQLGQPGTKMIPAHFPQFEKIHLKETLFAIHELHQSIEYIDRIFSLIREKIHKNMVDKSRMRINK